MKELFNDGKIKVSTNGSGEIFVERIGGTTSKEMPLELRIGTNGQRLQITAYGCNFEPTSFNGLGGFLIK